MLMSAVTIFCGFLLHVTGSGEGETCFTNDGTTGTCVLVTDCRIAVAALQKRKHPNLPHCGFNHQIEVLCCPNSEITSDIRVKGPEIRKSAKACNMYTKELLDDDVGPQILGGENAKIGEFPHMAALAFESETQGNDYEWKQCGGCLISSRYVLTAAHCVVRLDRKLPFLVRLGKIDLTGNTDNVLAHDYNVANVTAYPDYNISTKVNDIALISLQKDVAFNNNVSPACLYNRGDDPTDLIAIGWGLTSNQGINSDILQKTALKSIDVNVCNNTYSRGVFPRYILPSQLCANSNDSVVRDTCQGDSGSPIQIQASTQSKIYTVVGITSYGRGCGAKLPSIYTRVFSYLDWIEDIVWPSDM